ncbi:MAG: SH3 domain-containing protein [Chloroflexi bacterium]|nr:SH3 domain-containing protein [Chloroflexota bacterium]
MRHSIFTVFIIAISTFTFVYHGTVVAGTVVIKDDLIIITGQKANIRFAPNTSSQVVAQAKKGDIFKVKGKKDNWYEMIMFTGMRRYVFANLAKPTKAILAIPDLALARKRIFLAILQAEDRAMYEAEAKFPLSRNLNKNVDQARILEDQYKLEVIHKYNIQPPVYQKIIVEGIERNWDM